MTTINFEHLFRMDPGASLGGTTVVFPEIRDASGNVLFGAGSRPGIGTVSSFLANAEASRAAAFIGVQPVPESVAKPGVGTADVFNQGLVTFTDPSNNGGINVAAGSLVMDGRVSLGPSGEVSATELGLEARHMGPDASDHLMTMTATTDRTARRPSTVGPDQVPPPFGGRLGLALVIAAAAFALGGGS